MAPTKKEEIIAEKPVEGKAFVLKDFQYESNQSELTPEAKSVLDSILIPFLKERPTDKVTISSHTDDHGSHKYNQSLSQDRADKVIKYLISKGVDGSRLHAKGYGETKPCFQIRIRMEATTLLEEVLTEGQSFYS